MINFLRRIRRNLINENKPSIYLIYAIGEVVLVVFGILIALQINNWNEAKKERQIESKILNEILSNLDIDLQNLDLALVENNEFLIHNIEVLEHLQNDLPLSDSLKYHYSMLYGHGNFHPNTIGFDNLNSRGIDIIQNESLRNAVSELYSYKYFSIVEEKRTVVRKFQNFQIEEIYKNIKDIKSFEISEPINLKELRLNIQFRNTLLKNIFLLKWVNRRYTKGKEEIQIVQQKIHNELQK
jgi:hypothetical protein